MWKHVITSSIQSAFVGSVLLVVLCLPAYGGAATMFGLISFPIALVWCLVLAYPLISLRRKFRLPEGVFFIVYLVIGFFFGALTPVVMFGSAGAKFSLQSASFLGLYGCLGAASAITAWNYVRQHDLV